MNGTRFQIDLDNEDDIAPDQVFSPQSSTKSIAVVGDIIERKTSTPLAPAFKSPTSPAGWPSFKKRYQKQNTEVAETTEPTEVTDIPMLSQRHKSLSIDDSSHDSLQKMEIDAENRRRIAHMSTEEIEVERSELFENLNPALIAKLLSRSSIDYGTDSVPSTGAFNTERRRSSSSGSGKKVSFAIPESDQQKDETNTSAESHSVPLPQTFETSVRSRTNSLNDDTNFSVERKVSFATPDYQADDRDKTSAIRHSLPPTPPTDSYGEKTPPLSKTNSVRKVSFAIAEDEQTGSRNTAHSHTVPLTPPMDATPFPSEQVGNVHFPKPPPVPDLDPSSESFFDDLHSKYFPTLAHDPSKLDWMRPSTREENASYDPSSDFVTPSSMRFDFKGKIIPPSVSMSLPTDLGLHHHGDAPNAAGYTVTELGTLSRSAYPAQRCIAIQTLGRILYRLGKGEFGNEADMKKPGKDGQKAILTQGLWDEVQKSRVLDTLTEWASKVSGHQTSIALAQEAVWNWQQGGGRKEPVPS